MSSMTIGSGLYQSYSHIASGKRINTAADDAAGLAIGQKLQRQENGLSVAANNAQDGIGALNIADGALDGIMDYLQRIRELGLRLKLTSSKRGSRSRPKIQCLMNRSCSTEVWRI